MLLFNFYDAILLKKLPVFIFVACLFLYTFILFFFLLWRLHKIS